MYLAPLFLIFLTSFSSFVFSFDFSNSELRRELKIQAQNGQRTLSYDQARQNLFGKIYLERDNKGFFINDVYCYDQVRNGVGPKKIPNHAVINVEHSWPQSRFSSHAPLGVQKTDLHHLFPADSKANSKRANHIFGEVIVGVDPTDDCQESKIGYIENTIAFMPPAEIRGDIARALFYFYVRY
jgi:deoxyribonuclease-1